jgi:hypothetical protein
VDRFRFGGMCVCLLGLVDAVPRWRQRAAEQLLTQARDSVECMRCNVKRLEVAVNGVDRARERDNPESGELREYCGASNGARVSIS